MTQKYYVNNGGENIGPFELAIIFEKVAAAEFQATDHIYLEDKDEWVLICQHPEFLKRFANKPPKSGPNLEKPKATIPKEQSSVVEGTRVNEAIPQTEGTQSTAHGHDDWFVLKGKNRYGPYAFYDLLKMLQEKSIFEFDYIWKNGFESWKRIAEVSDFSPGNIRAIIDSATPTIGNEVFFRRRHSRIAYECEVVAHDNSKVWKGKSVELSEGGAGVIMENAMILPGQNVYIHFKPGPHSRPFNVLCEVVSKKYVKGVRDKNSPIVYGIKFINIHKQDRDEIKILSAA